MFSAKQQKKPVSRTISGSERKDVRQRVKNNQYSMDKHGIIQRVRNNNRITMVYTEILRQSRYNPQNPLAFPSDPYDVGCLPCDSGKITFTKLPRTTVHSSRFSGCYMAAFKFNFSRKAYVENVDFSIPAGIGLDGQTSYIAHIYTSPNNNEDTKDAFAQMVNCGFLKIEALFLPYDAEKDKEDKFSRAGKLMERNALKRDLYVVGALTKTADGRWRANTYYQYLDPSNQYHTMDREPNRAEINEEDLEKETYRRLGGLGVIIPSNKYQELNESLQVEYDRGLAENGEKYPDDLRENQMFDRLSANSLAAYAGGVERARQRARNNILPGNNH